MTTTAADQGLEKAKPTPPPEVIRTPDEYRDHVHSWLERKFNVLTPFTAISGLAPRFVIKFVSITLSTDPADGDCYTGLPWLKKDEYAPSKGGLRKFADALGISDMTERTDPRTIQFLWEFRATCGYRSYDGSTITRQATKEWDLRDGSPQMKGWTQNQIEEGRKHGLRNCEARAINAAIRECGVGIKQKYSKAELAKPFVILKVAYDPDMSDPVTRQLVTERALSSTAQLYPVTRPAPAEAPEPPQEARSVGRGSTVAKPEDPEPAAEDAPPTERAVRIAKVTPLEGTTPKGKKWTRWTIVDSNGEEHFTFDTGHKDTAEASMKEGSWVEIAEQESEDGRFTKITSIGLPQPSLLPDQDLL